MNELLALFIDLDIRYFGGCLRAAGYDVDMRNLDKPAGTVEYFCTPDGKLHATTIEGPTLGICIAAQRMILIHYHDGLEMLRDTLLHEMAHAAVDLGKPLRKGADPHGRRFVRELRRLVHPDYARYAWRLRLPAWSRKILDRRRAMTPL
jgi:hypothetical protein